MAMRAARPGLRTLLCGLIGLICVAQLPSATAQAASSNATIARSANVTGSLGYQCSSAAGILNLTQAAAAGQGAALNVTIPVNLTNAVAVQQIAQARRSQTLCNMVVE